MTVNSPVPPTAPIQKQGRSREFIMKSQTALIDTYSWECCLNCEHWTEHHVVRIKDETKYSGYREHDEGPRCMEFEQRPPTKVILIGCQEYEPAIPF